MALKLGKCRLCLKLGDFYSIFTVDNALQLAEMAMECARIKIFDGDGLPDKVCAECIEKLSSAYIFKQQCERSDEQLRRNYVPPPGFSVAPSPNRQSSDSGISHRTDLSNQKSKVVETESNSRNRKRSHESEERNYSRTYKASSSKTPEKRPRLPSVNTSNKESDDEDYTMSQVSAETDSDEAVMLKCDICDKQFLTKISLNNHKRIHTRAKAEVLKKNAVVDIPQQNVNEYPEDEEKVACDKCGKTFKLKIMLKRHQENCTSKPFTPQKELLVALENIVPEVNVKITCEICTAKFKTVDNLAKHMKVVHAAVLKRNAPTPTTPEIPFQKAPVPCLYCRKPFTDYFIHAGHFNMCTKRSNIQNYCCLVCKRHFGRKGTYFTHIREAHFEPKGGEGLDAKEEPKEAYDCRLCGKKVPTQEQLITHLAAHMSKADDGGVASSNDGDDRASTLDDTQSNFSEQSTSQTPGSLKCKFCDKVFTYKKSLANHIMKHTSGDIPVKLEPPDAQEYDDDDEDDDSDDGDNTCDICDKHFSYRRLLIQHKKTKHNMSSGYKRAKVALKDCDVKCLICDIDMKVGESNEHNKMHAAAQMKPRNVYTCAACSDTFNACQSLASHIKMVHRLNSHVTKKYTITNVADFCEVVVTKTEPLESIQSHSDLGSVPGTPVDSKKALVDLNGFTCPICSKKMATLISLKRHVNWHSNVGNNLESKHECIVCKMTFRFIRHYKLHMREHYHDTNLDPKFLTCEICNRKSKHLRAAQAHMKYHNQTRFGTKDYQCSICKRVFQHRKVYLSHMAIHYKRGESIQNVTVGSTGLPGGEHQCPHCGKLCDSETSLKCHVAWHKSTSSLYGSRYECDFCSQVFTNKRRRDIHVRIHYEDVNGPYKCHICGKGFIDEDYYRRHVKGHNFDNQSHKKRIDKLRANKVKCPICPRYYPDLVKLIRHLRRTHPETKMIKEDPDAPPPPIFPCKLCAKVFNTERRLEAHQSSHLRRHMFFKCKFCGKKAVSRKSHNLHIKGHLTKKHLDAPLRCYKCDETFIRGYDLHYHLRDDHGIRETWIAESGQADADDELQELQCSICMKILASKGNFERHIDYHNLLRCNYCFDHFNSLKFLEGHLAFVCEKKKLVGDTEVHPKKVKCQICYKAFHVQVKLDCHMRTKHGILVDRKLRPKEQQIVCDYCFRVFENEDALTSHKVYHRTVGYFGCIYCPRKFNTMTAYRKHKNHHFAQLNVDNPTKCEHCDETFVAFREMIYHMRDEHGDDKDWVILPKETTEEKCHICNKIFYNVQRHIQIHEENRCKKCGEYFLSRTDYDNHLCAIESDDDPEENSEDIRPKYEECTFCFKTITKANSKLKHDLIHKGSGSISCRFCALKFKTMDAFNIHAFSHRSRSYKRNPLKCRKCNERFVKYGPFMKHMKTVHRAGEKMHYRTTILAEPCALCGGLFPNLHNHYRAHLQTRCMTCGVYYTSSRALAAHSCDVPDPLAIRSDLDVPRLIREYVPRDEDDDHKYYGHSDDEDEAEPNFNGFAQDESSQLSADVDIKVPEDIDDGLKLMPLSIQSPIISDVLSLYEARQELELRKAEAVEDDDIVEILDDNSVDLEPIQHETITIDD